MTGQVPLTSVVIVTYNSLDDIEGCLTSFAGAAATEAVVVDNNSSDGTPARLIALKDAGLIDTLILSPTNDGFAKAVNRGIAASTGRDVLLLNPDATLTADSLVALRDAAYEDSARGIVAPVVHSGPTVATMAAGEQPVLWPMFTHFSGLARAFPGVRALRGRYLYLEPHGRTNQVVGWTSGCCLYIKGSVLGAVGPLSERWFMYGEDVEFCRRVTKAGYKVEIIASISAEHLIGASVNRSSGRVSTMWSENTFDYYVTEFHPGPLRRFAWRSIFSLGMFARAALLSAKGARADPAAKPEYRARADRFARFAASVWRRRASAQ